MSLHSDIRKTFEEGYFKIADTNYYWTPKDAKNTKQLIQKLTFITKQKGETTDEKISYSFLLITEMILTLPELSWYKQNFSIPIINSKLNDIIATIKQGKSGKHQKTATELRGNYEGIKAKEQPINWRNRS